MDAVLLGVTYASSIARSSGQWLQHLPVRRRSWVFRARVDLLAEWDGAVAQERPQRAGLARTESIERGRVFRPMLNAYVSVCPLPLVAGGLPWPQATAWQSHYTSTEA